MLIFEIAGGGAATGLSSKSAFVFFLLAVDLGNATPQLIVRLSFALFLAETAGVWGEEEWTSSAIFGLTGLLGVLNSAAEKYRFSKSIAGSVCATTSEVCRFCRSKLGLAIVEGCDDEMGEELRARLVPRGVL
jgi:hypothetical protein